MTFFKTVIDGQIVNIRIGRATPEGVDYGDGVEGTQTRLRIHKIGVYASLRPTTFRMHGAAVFGTVYTEPEPVDAIIRVHSVKPEGAPYVEPPPPPEDVFLRVHQAGPVP